MPDNKKSLDVLAVIPARFASTRFPGKPLASDTGRPLIQHVVEQVQQAKHVSRIIVATDDQRIFDAVKSFHGQVMMTRADHQNGTSRIAEVVEKIGADLNDNSIILNVQGDEPEIEPRVIDELIETLAADDDAEMATLASDFADGEDPADPNIVKLITNQLGRAIYFSRSLIPCDRDSEGVTYLKHPGCYAYRRWFLLKYVTLPPTPLEQAEKLEQLRAIEHGYRIAVKKTTVNHHGIDTPEQYAEFVQRMKSIQ